MKAPKRVAVLTTVLLLVAFGSASLAGTARQAPRRPVPTSRERLSARHDCELFLPANVTRHVYVADQALTATIDNGSARRDVIMQLSAEGATTDEATIIGVRYSIDGGRFDVHGPELFVSEPNFETHTNISIMSLGPGRHTISPGYEIWAGGGTGQLLFRCLTVEFGR